MTSFFDISTPPLSIVPVRDKSNSAKRRFFSDIQGIFVQFGGQIKPKIAKRGNVLLHCLKIMITTQIGYALFFFYEKKDVQKKIFKGRSCFFEGKIVDFSFKKQLRPDRFSRRTPFEQSEKQCVPYLISQAFFNNFVILQITHYVKPTIRPLSDAFN